ncbi:thioesterase II family protein [Streptomyces sp. NPDC101062]|uniref:thioesterase II family protein n=2 Tax=unclassified Streptomyces TaxID=2593676 RepID=UPI00381054CB
MCSMSMSVSYHGLPGADAPVRLIAFHHAGGSASSFLPVVKELPDGCGGFLFELGGRFGETGSAPAADFRAAHERFLPDFLQLVDRPALVIGHSLGALFAHNLVAALPPERAALVRTLVVSASKGPAVAAEEAPMPAAPFLVRSASSVMEDLRTFGGTDPEFLEDPDFAQAAVGQLGHDLHLADTYTLPPGPPSAVPHLVWYGQDDVTLAEADRLAWSGACARPPEHEGFPGGHFYLFERPEPAARLRELTGALTAEGFR